MFIRKFISTSLIMSVVFVANTTTSFAAENQRPSANNKVKHTKKSAAEIENSIIRRIMKNEVFTSNESESNVKTNQVNSNELVINQIKTLSELNRDGFLTDEEFETKKALLLDRIQ